MPRLFVGAFPPEYVALEVHRAVLEPLAGARVRIVPPAEIHLTLEFLGATEESAVEGIVERLRLALEGKPAAALRIRGTGAFPDAGRARVLWVGIEGPLPSVAPEEPSAPHLTVARAIGESRVRVPSAFLEVGILLPWILDEVRLVESRPGALGPQRFPTIAAFRLSRDSL